MIQAANEFAAKCPNSPIIFVGYSLGGVVVMNTLCGGISPNKNVVSAIVYGEETYRGRQIWDKSTCTADAVSLPCQHREIPGWECEADVIQQPSTPRSDPLSCLPFAAVIADYCLAEDSLCCATGTDHDVHFTYPTRYDHDALRFIELRYSLWKATQLPRCTTS